MVMLSVNNIPNLNFKGLDSQVLQKQSQSKDAATGDTYTNSRKEQIKKACRKSFLLGVLSTTVLFIANAAVDNYLDKKDEKDMGKILGKTIETKNNKSSWPFRWFFRLFKK